MNRSTQSLSGADEETRCRVAAESPRYSANSGDPTPEPACKVHLADWARANVKRRRHLVPDRDPLGQAHGDPVGRRASSLGHLGLRSLPTVQVRFALRSANRPPWAPREPRFSTEFEKKSSMNAAGLLGRILKRSLKLVISGARI